jgi:hypothetical protein
LVLWSSRKLQQKRMPHFPTIYSIWSPGPHEIYKSRVSSIFFYCAAHLVLWSSQNVEEQRMQHFRTIYSIWSTGPHKIYKSRVCPIFLLLSSFGPLVLTKFTRSENVSLSYYLSHLVLWSSQNLEEQSLRYFFNS